MREFFRIVKKLFNNYLFNFALIILIGVLVVYVVLKDNGIQILSMIKRLDFNAFLILIFCTVFYQLIIGKIITELCRTVKKDYKLFQGFVNATVAGLFQGITPSATGGQFAQIYVFKKQGIDFSDAAGILWLDFIVYQSSFVAFTLIMILCKFRYFIGTYREYMGLVIIGFLINGSVIISLMLMVLLPSVYKWISHQGIDLLVKMKAVKDKEASIKKLDGRLAEFERGINRLKSNGRLILKLIFLNIIRLAFYYSIPSICATLLGIEVSFTLYIDMIVLASFVSLVNAFNPLPGASGGMEAMYLIMFSHPLGNYEAISTMFLWRMTSFYFVLILGILAFIGVKYGKRKNKGDQLCA